MVYVPMGLHISVSGGLTRPMAGKTRAAAQTVPLDRILLETDAPDQLPHTREAIQNEPAFLGDVVQCMADLRQLKTVDVAAQTEQNARKLFGI